MKKSAEMANSGKQGTVVVMATNILTSGAMSQIWGMINGMQIYSHMPLMNVEYPMHSKTTVNSILEIASFSVIPTEDGVNAVLEPPEEDDEYKDSKFEDMGFESFFTVINLGSLFVAFIFLFTFPLIFILLCRPFRNRSKYINNKYQNLSDGLHGNMIVRYILEACLDIALCIGLQVHYYAENVDGAKLFDFDDFFFTVNTIITAILGILIVIFLPVVGVFYVRRFK